MNPENKAYDVSAHMADTLERQAVSQIDRLRCEMAARLQQINYRVERALANVGMSRFDVSHFASKHT